MLRPWVTPLAFPRSRWGSWEQSQPWNKKKWRFMVRFWGWKGLRQVDQKNNIERCEKDRQDVVFIQWMPTRCSEENPVYRLWQEGEPCRPTWVLFYSLGIFLWRRHVAVSSIFQQPLCIRLRHFRRRGEGNIQKFCSENRHMGKKIKESST